jgi:hypothetical protein
MNVSCKVGPLAVALALYLSATSAEAADPRDIHTSYDLREAADIARATAFLGHSFRSQGFGGRVRSCELVVNTTMGRENHTYGAICETDISGRKHPMLICADEMVGHFALKTSAFALARDEVVAFTKANCSGS